MTACSNTCSIGWPSASSIPSDRPKWLSSCARTGAGKGMFVRAFGSIFGQHFTHISQSKHLTGNFNAHLEDCVVLFVDEGFWAGDKQGEAVLKHMITEPTLTIEPKGQNVEQVHNRLHMLMASNSEWVVPAGGMNGGSVLVVADSVKQDEDYFGALVKELQTERSRPCCTTCCSGTFSTSIIARCRARRAWSTRSCSR